MPLPPPPSSRDKAVHAYEAVAFNVNACTIVLWKIHDYIWESARFWVGREKPNPPFAPEMPTLATVNIFLLSSPPPSSKPTTETRSSAKSLQAKRGPATAVGKPLQRPTPPGCSRHENPPLISLLGLKKR